ncbi:TnsD family Tn7-like transposition protein [Bacillus tuaregi]|uniref:TnsD family Tn7-like transposition protein n=1 Tax=Bacillus tuaregi TaxID=1816695 RepID=UPI0008F85F83|nr:TnsD family Tn7-like transposition protein [Bacillus tuaregi]
MLPFFTEPYPDELIYSAIARYHFYSGNIDYKDTLEEVFQSRSVIPSIEIGSHFHALVQQMGNHYSVDKLLANHTVYPFYAPFLSKQRQQDILRDVQDDGKGLYARLGMVAGSICRKEGLYYCPQCSLLDIEKYGEPYIHREHQLQGVDLCSRHFLQLKKYPVDFTTCSRIEFIRFDAKRMDFSILQGMEPPDYFNIQVKLATMAYQLLNLNIAAFSREMIVKRYRLLLRERNLITVSNRVRQKELFDAVQAKFPDGFLEKYNSGLNKDDEYNWLRVLTRNIKRHVHPFRHLLFLCFLDQDVEGFLLLGEDAGPFGKGPWPCLNKAADHYRQFVIPKVIITRDFKSASPIGTFECSCGFIYSRKGPDKSNEDKYRIGRIKAFGDIWVTKLHSLASEGNQSTRSLANMLGVDSKTVKKYLSEYEQKEQVGEHAQFPMIEQYRKQLLEGIQQSPGYSRTQIRSCFSKQYTYLYRHDKEWLFQHLPVKRKQSNRNVTVDWSDRDEGYFAKINQLYKELMGLEKPIRITTSLIGKLLGILPHLEKHLDKLPRTKRLLKDITESARQFQIRRCCKIIDTMLQKQEPIALWKVQRIGAVKSHHFHEIKPHLEAYIRVKQEVKAYG